MVDVVKKFSIYILFMMVSILIIWTGINSVIANNGFYQNAIKTKGEIIYISSGQKVKKAKVSIVVDNKTYTKEIGEYNSRMKVGDEITVYYNKENPNDFRASSAGYVGYAFIVFGAIFVIALGIRMKKEIQYIREERKNDRRIYYNRK